MGDSFCNFYVHSFCFVNNNSDQMMCFTIISSFTSVKVPDNRQRPSCNEPSRSSSTSSGAVNAQDPRKKTSELTKSIVDAVTVLQLSKLVKSACSDIYRAFLQKSEWKLYISNLCNPDDLHSILHYHLSFPVLHTGVAPMMAKSLKAFKKQLGRRWALLYDHAVYSVWMWWKCTLSFINFGQ